jgi:hypothetical protein
MTQLQSIDNTPYSGSVEMFLLTVAPVQLLLAVSWSNRHTPNDDLTSCPCRHAKRNTLQKPNAFFTHAPRRTKVLRHCEGVRHRRVGNVTMHMSTGGNRAYYLDSDCRLEVRTTVRCTVLSVSLGRSAIAVKQSEVKVETPPTCGLR